MAVVLPPGLKLRIVPAGADGYKAQLISKSTDQIYLTSTRVFRTKAAARAAMKHALEDIDKATRQLAAARRSRRGFGQMAVRGMPHPRRVIAEASFSDKGVVYAARQYPEWVGTYGGASQRTEYYRRDGRTWKPVGYDSIPRQVYARLRERLAESRKLREGRGYGSAKKVHRCRPDSHEPGCRVSRPLCKHRRKTCKCAAAPWPHRPGSMRGCSAGGKGSREEIPEAVLRSPSWKKASGYLRRIFGGRRRGRNSRGRFTR